MKNFTVIAEIGCCHIGNLERAKNLAKLAKLSGADILKTQKRNPSESVREELKNTPHPNQIFAYGKTYLEHRINLELNIEEHNELKQYCESIDIEYSTSVWDITSAKTIIDINPYKIKIPSACNKNIKLINFLLNNFKGQIHISTGMLAGEDLENLINYLLPYKEKIVIYHCTSGYPVPFENLYLYEIKNLCKKFPMVGFSNHGYGIATEPIAYTLGSRYFERHFIDDRIFPHTDASASLEPDGMRRLIRNLNATEKALSYKPLIIPEIEKIQEEKLRI